LEAELLSEANTGQSVRDLVGRRLDLVDGTVFSLCVLLDFYLNAAAYALQEWVSSPLGRRLGLVELEGCESGAFVDGVAED
jgi:hypothetical protein